MFDYRQEMKLAPYVTWTQIEDRVYICGGTRETSFDIEESKPPIATLQWLRSRAGGAMWGEICQELSRNCKDNKLETVGLDYLANPYLYIFDRDFKDRYDRPKLYYNYMGANPAVVQSRLQSSSVIILGCGGVGSIVAAGLAGSGIGHIHLIDDDVVELSNLSRQILYTEADLGKSKCAVLARRLRNINSEITVTMQRTAFVVDDVTLAHFAGADLIMLSADSSAELIGQVIRAAAKTGAAVIQAGYVNDIPICGPLVEVETSNNWQRFFSALNEDEGDGISEWAYQAPSHAWTNFVCAGLVIDDVVAYLGRFKSPISLDCRVGLYKDDLKFNLQRAWYV